MYGDAYLESQQQQEIFGLMSDEHETLQEKNWTPKHSAFVIFQSFILMCSKPLP